MVDEARCRHRYGGKRRCIYWRLWLDTPVLTRHLHALNWNSPRTALALLGHHSDTGACRRAGRECLLYCGNCPALQTVQQTLWSRKIRLFICNPLRVDTIGNLYVRHVRRMTLHFASRATGITVIVRYPNHRQQLYREFVCRFVLYRNDLCSRQEVSIGSNRLVPKLDGSIKRDSVCRLFHL